MSSGTYAGAYAIVRQDDPQIFLAADAAVLDRVLALNLVARTASANVSDRSRLEEMRRALLDERWADALAAWIDETGTPVDVYDEPVRVWTDAELDAEHASVEIRLAPLFAD